MKSSRTSKTSKSRKTSNNDASAEPSVPKKSSLGQNETPKKFQPPKSGLFSTEIVRTYSHGSERGTDGGGGGGGSNMTDDQCLLWTVVLVGLSVAAFLFFRHFRRKQDQLAAYKAAVIQAETTRSFGNPIWQRLLILGMGMGIAYMFFTYYHQRRAHRQQAAQSEKVRVRWMTFGVVVLIGALMAYSHRQNTAAGKVSAELSENAGFVNTNWPYAIGLGLAYYSNQLMKSLWSPPTVALPASIGVTEMGLQGDAGLANAVGVGRRPGVLAAPLAFHSVLMEGEDGGWDSRPDDAEAISDAETLTLPYDTFAESVLGDFSPVDRSRVDGPSCSPPNLPDCLPSHQSQSRDPFSPRHCRINHRHCDTMY